MNDVDQDDGDARGEGVSTDRDRLGQAIDLHSDAGALAGEGGAVYLVVNPDQQVWKIEMTEKGWSRINSCRGVISGKSMKRPHEATKHALLRQELHVDATLRVLQIDRPRLLDAVLTVLFDPTETTRVESESCHRSNVQFGTLTSSRFELASRPADQISRFAGGQRLLDDMIRDSVEHRIATGRHRRRTGQCDRRRNALHRHRFPSTVPVLGSIAAAGVPAARPSSGVRTSLRS